MAERATPQPVRSPSAIGTMREGHLHASLKERYLQAGDLVEATVDGYVVDILRGDLVIEVQTSNFSGIAAKIRALAGTRTVRLVYPVPAKLWLVKLDEDGSIESRRRSPRRGHVVDVFEQLVSFPELITHKRFELDVVLTREEEVRMRLADGHRRWRRRGWARVERRLLDVLETVSFRCPADFAALLPALPDEFLTSDLAVALGRPRRLAQQAAYCLRRAELIEECGRQGNAVVYRRGAELTLLPSPALRAPSPTSGRGIKGQVG